MHYKNDFLEFPGNPTYVASFLIPIFVTTTTTRFFYTTTTTITTSSMDRAEEEAIEQKHYHQQQTKYEHHPPSKHDLNDNDDISVIIDTTAGGNKDITKEDMPSRHVHFLMAHRYNDHPTDGNGSHDDNNGTWSNVLLSGLAPLGQQKSPAVCIWILLIMVLVAISGELLWSKETAGESPTKNNHHHHQQ